MTTERLNEIKQAVTGGSIATHDYTGMINELLSVLDREDRILHLTCFCAQKLLEDWWNEDPEMRYVEVMCGQDKRVNVRLFQITIPEVSQEAPDYKVGEGEAGTLLEAIQLAIASAVKPTCPCHGVKS